jgi:hypothetical protein
VDSIEAAALELEAPIAAMVAVKAAICGDD